jgi:pyrimidine-specific ribonucleoside hydrolase
MFAGTLGASAPLIIDTDAGLDDLMAIAFLLAHQPATRIEAITTANGLAHTDRGAFNILRLLTLAGNRDTRVFAGKPTPLEGAREFPRDWRELADQLPGVQMPSPTRRVDDRNAVDYLIERLRDPKRPVKILALGPLTNLGEALRRAPASVHAIEEIVIMGGALGVPGNLADGGITDNRSAEWNVFIDPRAARIVFASGVNIRLVPLDATRRVPIDTTFLAELHNTDTPLGAFVGQILELARGDIERGVYQAWDPLAAVAFIHPAVLRKLTRTAIEVLPSGQIVRASRRQQNISAALDADPARFRRIFLQAWRAPR